MYIENIVITIVSYQYWHLSEATPIGVTKYPSMTIEIVQNIPSKF